MNQYLAINLNGNGEDLSDINLKLLRPKAFAKFLLGLTYKKWTEDSKENVEKGIKAEDKNTDCENENEHSNKNAILSNIEKVKKMNPNNFIGKGKFSNLPDEIKVVMLQRIFEFRGNTKFDIGKSLSENVKDMILKYQRYPKDVLLNILRLCLDDMTEKFMSKKDSQNQINQIDKTTNDDFLNRENLAQAIKKIFDDDNCLLNDEQLTLLYEYYGRFSATQNEIKEITEQKDFFDAIEKIKKHSDYKDINNKNLKNAFLRGRLKACKHKWNFNQDLLQKLLFDEQMIIIPHLQNFIIKGKKQNNNEQNQQQNELVIKYIERPKDFANLLNMHFSDENGELSNDKNIKIQAEIINNNVLIAVFFDNAIGEWLKYISEGNDDLRETPDDIVEKLVHVASQKCDKYDFSYDLSSLNIDELLDFYAKSEVQNKIEISSKKDEDHQETVIRENIQLLTQNAQLTRDNLALTEVGADLLRGLKLKDKECKKYACNIEAKQEENSVLMPIYICLCTVGIAFAGFMLWLISLISVTWAIVQTSIFIVSILFLLLVFLIDTDKHKKFDQIRECFVNILVIANLPVIFVQSIVLYVICGYLDDYVQNRVNLKYPLNTIYKKPSKQIRENIAGIEVIVEERWNNDVNNNQLVVGNNQ